MTEKVSLIKNPLTIIAIFAGIAEVSGTIVLPFIHESNQVLFIYFLISFPSVLVALFFITLNFNNKVLYAPSDYKDESNYIRINKFDVSQQKTIQLKIPKNDTNSQRIIQLTERIDFLNSQIVNLENTHSKKQEHGEIKEEYIDTIGNELLVSNFENANDFISRMKSFDIDFKVYHSPGEDLKHFEISEHKAIWLGNKVNIKAAKFIIKEAKEIYPHLKYIKIFGDEWNEENQIYIGGSTESAVNKFRRLPMKDSDFKHLESFSDIKLFHEFINRFKK